MHTRKIHFFFFFFRSYVTSCSNDESIIVKYDGGNLVLTHHAILIMSGKLSASFVVHNRKQMNNKMGWK